ncbi:hypothetical protein MTO96_024721 [Rhipicephalus appendiculatus]
MAAGRKRSAQGEAPQNPLRNVTGGRHLQSMAAASCRPCFEGGETDEAVSLLPYHHRGSYCVPPLSLRVTPGIN